METQLVQIREQQREIWNRFSPGWKKWNNLNMDFLKPMADEIIYLIKPKDTDVVLDVASGTGEPGLTIATMLRGGTVVATDLAEGMLEVVAPVVAALSKADCEMKIKIRDEVFQSIEQKYSSGELAFGSDAFIIYGEK